MCTGQWTTVTIARLNDEGITQKNNLLLSELS